MDVIFHLLLPFLLLAFFDIRDKWLYILMPFALLPDIISLFAPGRVSHSIVLAAIIFIAILLIVRRANAPRKIYYFSGFYMASHLLLDLGSWMPLLWPLSPTYYKAGIEVIIIDSIPKINIIFETASEFTGGMVEAGYIPTPITVAGFALVAILLIALIIRNFNLDAD